MTVVINGTTGITSVNGTAGAPSVTGADTDTGIVYGTNTLSLATGGTTAVTVDSSQNVGIGTSSPTSSLVVSGAASGTPTVNGVHLGVQGSYATIELCNTTGAFIDFTSSGTDNKGRLFYDNTNNYMSFVTNGSERARIDSSGNLLVGTTTQKAKFTVEGSTSANYLIATNDTRSGADGASASVLFYRAGSIVGSIQTASSTTSYVTSSDYRLKENIAPMTGALSVVSALKPCTYTWKSDGSASQGFIAHELQAVVPEAVVGEKDAVNEDGSIKPQGIDTSFLVATLTAAIQELKAEFDAYKAAHP